MRQPKQGYLGPAFHEWLEWLEYIECVATTNKRPGKPKHMAMNDKLFKCDTDADFQKMMRDCYPVDAWLARCVRSSVKYTVKAETLALMTHQYEDEMRYIRETRPLHLPHEWVTLIVEDLGPDTFMMCLQETTTRHGKPYPELGVEGDEPWISSNPIFYRKTGIELMTDSKVHPEAKLSYCPIEQHMNSGKLWRDTTYLNANAHGVTVTPEGERAMDMVQGMTMAFLESFHLSSILRRKSVGVAPALRTFVPKKRRKKKDHPRFEHFVVEMEVDEPDPSQSGRSVFQPKKRLHQVRGFFRHLRSGKTVWVKPHWRGDEHLGVVKKDFEVTMHNNEGDNNVNESKAVCSEPAGQADQSGRTGDRSVLRDGTDSVWDRTRKALGAAWVSVVRTSR